MSNPITIADGADFALGATTDAYVIGNNDGSVVAFLRGLSVMLANMWSDSHDALQTTSAQGSLTDRSGSITSGGAAQTLMASNGTRHYMLIQNISSGDLWIDFTSTASAGAGSRKLGAGELFQAAGTFCSTEVVSIYGATTGQAFTAKEG